jgi:hypothetical protein
MVINVNANFNESIRLSFMGQIDAAIVQTNFQWLMFYPCLYFFSMWDAFKNSGGEKSRFSYLPFVFSGFFVTVGIMYSTKIKIFGFLLGPVWFPMLGVIPGLIIGFALKRILKTH